MSKTGMYCTNCNREFEEHEDVIVVHGGMVVRGYVDYHVAPDDDPNHQTLCKGCATALLVGPQRIVVEVQDGVVVMIRAIRPDDITVIVRDFDDPLFFTEDGMPLPVDVWGQDGIPIGKLNTVRVSNSIEEGVGHVMKWVAECEEEARPLQHPKLQA